jgi:putative phage-type endonuclease
VKKLNLNQGSEPWHRWRADGLGGSDIAAVMGLSPYDDATRAAVLRAKVTGEVRPPNFAMRRGHNLEPHARAAYMQRARCVAPPVCVEMAGCPWARVSLDGLCSNGAVIPAERREWVLELKAPGWETHDLLLSGCVPEHFAVQVQWQMLVCGVDRCDLASFNPSARYTPAGAVPFDTWSQARMSERPAAPADWLAVVPVAADPGRQAEIMEEAARFWFEVLEARAALPKPDHSRFEAEVV